MPLGLGILLNLLADKTFTRNKTTVKPFEKSTTLVTGGVFCISRHPMYLGMVLILFRLAILLGKLTPFLIPFLYVPLMNTVYIGTEERMLEETFGDRWLEYKSKVRRWI